MMNHKNNFLNLIEFKTTLSYSLYIFKAKNYRAHQGHHLTFDRYNGQ